MTNEGIFHDAHEVYARPIDGVSPWQWIGTCATESLALDLMSIVIDDHGFEAEVRPV